MSDFIERLRAFSKPASTDKQKNQVIKTVGRADIVELNAAIQPKIDKNRNEKNATEMQIRSDKSKYKNVNRDDEER